jgi:hypothetical protein
MIYSGCSFEIIYGSVCLLVAVTQSVCVAHRICWQRPPTAEKQYQESDVERILEPQNSVAIQMMEREKFTF